ncbi:unnamed protein product [Phytophthora fragariaefolia]|uniref:Unnamed protein product n=1 Tax=Phytophthora fragariaefolia TaxID=1490495 RepID=A0A9W7D2Q6_9STRA|nr:unnamed protein product [Phytophthora fragariaefolia]
MVQMKNEDKPVANLAGEIPDEFLDAGRCTVQECLEYTAAKLGAIATSNPVACAQYFNHVMDIVIEVLSNWDRVKKCSKTDKGIFGITKAYVSSTESQGSTGNHHGHMVIWTFGMAKTVDEYYTACKSNDVKQRLMDYIESIANSTFPVDNNRCPSCERETLDEVALTTRC